MNQCFSESELAKFPLGSTWTITASPYEGAKYWFSFKKKKAIYTRKFCLQFSLLFEKLSLLGHFIPLCTNLKEKLIKQYLLT